MTTGYVYEEICLKHNLPGHPENRSRLEEIIVVLQRTGMLTRLTHIPARPATLEELTRVHKAGYVDQVEKMSERGGGHLDPDTYTNSDSYQAALMAAGGLIEATLAVIDGQVHNAFALVRPPGHHAMPGHGMGFCLFGNVAIATFHGYFQVTMGEGHLSSQLQSTLVFVKTDDSWKIVHEHFSPLDTSEQNQSDQ